MTITLKSPELRELKPRIMVCGVGGGGCNAVNNMIASGLVGVDFIVANTDAQALTSSRADRIIQMGLQVTEGLGAGAQPEVGRAAAEEAIEEIRDHLMGAHMCFVTAGMGGGTGTGAAPVIARAARDLGILTVGVVTKPFQFEGMRRMRTAEAGIAELQKNVDTLIVIPNQNLFRIATERTTFADAFSMADQVLYSGVASITDLMVKQGLVNLDFADVRSIMREMGKAMMGTGEASGDKRAVHAAEAAIANPLLDEVSMKGAKGLLISITGGADMTLYEVDEAASRIRQEVDEDANIILGATFDESLEGVIRVSVVATGIDKPALGAQAQDYEAAEARIAEAAQRLRAQAAMQRAAEPLAPAAPVVQTAAQPAPAPVAEPAPQPVYEAPVQREAPQAVESAAPVYAQAPAYTPAPQAHQPAPQAAEAHYPSAPEQAPAGYYETPVEAQYETPVYEPQSYEPRYEQPRAAQPGHYAPRQPVYAPAAEQPIRPRPMPTISDLPRPVQEQIQQRVQAEPHVGEQRRRTLFERLAAIAGKGDEQRPAPEAYRAPPAPMPQQRPAAPSPAHAEYAKRPQAPAARPAAPQARPAAPRSAEDELEIPAFLRRQSNLG